MKWELSFSCAEEKNWDWDLLNTVNSLVSDHPWCTTKWSLTGGGRLRERSTN